jgi:hypothetical protein
VRRTAGQAHAYEDPLSPDRDEDREDHHPSGNDPIRQPLEHRPHPRENALYVLLWQASAATTGDVILVATLGLAVLHATRDLAVALLDVTQHMARFSEALSTLLVPHEMCDRPGRG